jgi:hypothetical protein
VRRLRTIRRFVPFLIGLFMVAQLAGVVSFEDSHAHAAVAASAEPHPADHAAHQDAHAVGHHHGHDGMGNAIDHGLGGGGVAGHCCALHAFLVGVAPPVLTSLFANLGRGERLEVGSDLFAGLTGSRLDRPPRSHLSI